MEFKNYLLTEGKEYFADRVNSVLTGIHDFLSAERQMGAKQSIKQTENIANQIRKILHTSWPQSEHKHLKVLQRCGIALMKAIDDKGDLPEVFNSVRAELESLSHRLKVPANKLGTKEKGDKERKPEAPPPGSKDQQTPQEAVPPTESPAQPMADAGGTEPP
jgi:hypothetical protein